MNTPAHVVINLLGLGRQDTAVVLSPVVIGAILPDAPIFIFYFYEKVIRNMPEAWIWRVGYYQPHWQNFIDVFNSLPLIGLALAIAYWQRSQFGILLCLSMVLHIAGDLPVHHDDGHRHFFPFSNWRFESPVSYWDSNHYGNIFSVIEILAVVASCWVLFQGYQSWAGRAMIGLVGVTYTLYFGYVFAVWKN
ncbi:MAG: hypothetical protein KME20_25475 [Kaiparowitsia implicata GSE-PSE-MK54-09C]|jgi:hypothetical protein|nr:hypothetical protein [Kaiparowitsia implicata GSE-PSE-MK54-09C]